MRHRFLASLGALAVVIAIVSLMPVPLAGQAPSAAANKAKTWTAPRTPDGHPDLQGIWDFRSITPLERPDKLAGKQVLTDQEAAAVETEAAQRLIDRDRSVGLGPGGSSYNVFWLESGTAVKDKRSSLIVDPPDGRIPALVPEAQKRKEAVAQARRGVQPDAPTPGGWVHDLGPTGLRVRCILGMNVGPPMTPHSYNQNVQLFQTPGYVVLLNEMIHDARIVPLDGRPHGTLRQWAGDSRGRWEGNTLVVDTINFHAATLRTVDEFSANMHLVERFTRVDADTLLYEFTVEDPTTWTRPWTAQIPMRKSQDLMYEYACHEGNYGLYNILAGARAQEEADGQSAKKGAR